LVASSFYVARLEECVTHSRAARDGSDPASQTEGFVLGFGRDPVTVALVHESMAYSQQGKMASAIATSEQAIAHSETWPHPFSLLWARIAKVFAQIARGEIAEVREGAASIVRDSEAQGFPNWMAQAMVYQGWATVRLGEPAGIELLQQGSAIWQMTGSGLIVPFITGLQSDALRRLGETGRAEELIVEAVEMTAKTHEFWSVAELHRLAGDVHRDRHLDDEARSSYETAIELADRFGLVTAGLAAAISLAELIGPGAFDRDDLARRLALIEGGAGLRDVVAAEALLAG